MGGRVREAREGGRWEEEGRGEVGGDGEPGRGDDGGEEGSEERGGMAVFA